MSFGGCAQNSVANGKIYQIRSLKIYVSSSSGDSGGAIGSATHLAKNNIFEKEYSSYYGLVLALIKYKKVYIKINAN